jgi:hypothetical protein
MMSREMKIIFFFFYKKKKRKNLETRIVGFSLQLFFKPCNYNLCPLAFKQENVKVDPYLVISREMHMDRTDGLDPNRVIDRQRSQSIGSILHSCFTSPFVTVNFGISFVTSIKTIS